MEFITGHDDYGWADSTKFGYGIAKSIVSLILAHGGGQQAWPFDCEALAEDMEFTPEDIRAAVARLILNGHARIEPHPFGGGQMLMLLTPSRRAHDAKVAAAEEERARQKAEKLALRGGRTRRAAIPAVQRQRIYTRDGHRCLTCGAVDDLTLDHIHPWSLGGPDTDDNLRTLCRPCNSRKGDR